MVFNPSSPLAVANVERGEQGGGREKRQRSDYRLLADAERQVSLCSAGQSGYNMAPVREVLLAARARYHDLLSADLELLAAKAVADDDLQHVSSSFNRTARCLCVSRNTKASLVCPWRLCKPEQQVWVVQPSALRNAVSPSNSAVFATIKLRPCRLVLLASSSQDLR